MPALWLSRVSKSFEQGNDVLKKCNLMVMQNEFFLIWGPSGTGKSTLLRLIAGLDKANEGHLILQDHIISLNERAPLHPGRQEIGFVFQDNALTSNRNVFDNVRIPLEYHLSWQLEFDSEKLDMIAPILKRPIHLHPRNPNRYQELQEYIEDRAMTELKKMLVSKERHKLPHQISLGVRKRVAIARAMALNPKILLLDEPTAGLDVENRLLVLALLTNLSQLDGKAIVMVTHDLQIARDIPYAKISVLMDGHLTTPMNFSELASIYSKDDSQEIFLTNQNSLSQCSEDERNHISGFLHNAVCEALDLPIKTRQKHHQ